MALALYALTAGALLLAAHRWGFAMRAAVAIALLLMPLAVVGAGLLSTGVYGPLDLALEHEPLASLEVARQQPIESSMAADIAVQIVPWQMAVRHAVDHRQWPLWNPFMMAGDSLLGSAQAAPFHPFNLLSLLLPVERSTAFLAAITLFWAALGGFLWCRQLGCQSGPALLGGACWSLSQFLLVWLLWPLALTASHLPWIAFAVRRLLVTSKPFRDGRRPTTTSRSVVLLAIVLASMLHAGHPETSAHLVAIGSIYGLFELALARRDGSSWRWLGRRLGMIFVAGALAIGCAAISILPTLDALEQSAQLEGRQLDSSTGDQTVPVRQALGRARTAAVPFVFGTGWRQGPPVIGYFVPASSAYVGSAIFGLALFGLFRHRWPGRWLMALLAIAAIAVGASMPGITDLLASLPVFELAIHRRLVMVAPFAISTLAALGADVALDSSRRSLSLCHAVALAGVLIALALSLPRLLDSELTHGFIAASSGLLLAPLAAAMVVSSCRWPGGRKVLAIGLLLVAQRVGEAADRYPTVDRERIYPPVPILDAARLLGKAGLEKAELDKAGLDKAGPWRFVATGELLPPNLATVYGLEDIRGYQPLALGSWTAVEAAWSTGGSPWFRSADDLERPFLDLVGVRWALDRQQVELPAGWRLAAEDGGFEDDGFEDDAFEDGFRLLENQQALARAFVPERLIRGADRQQIMSWLRWQASDEVAFLDSRATAGEKITVDNGRGKVITRRDGNDLLLTADLEQAATIVVSEPAWRGWRARAIEGSLVSGPELEIETANLTLLALELPAGRHVVRLRFMPMSFVVGAWTSLLSLLAACLMMLLGQRQDHLSNP